MTLYVPLLFVRAVSTTLVDVLVKVINAPAKRLPLLSLMVPVTVRKSAEVMPRAIVAVAPETTVPLNLPTPSTATK